MRELPGGLWWHCHGAQANPGRERPGATAEGHALILVDVQGCFLQVVVTGMLRWVCLREKIRLCSWLLFTSIFADRDG